MADKGTIEITMREIILLVLFIIIVAIIIIITTGYSGEIKSNFDKVVSGVVSFYQGG